MGGKIDVYKLKTERVYNLHKNIFPQWDSLVNDFNKWKSIYWGNHMEKSEECRRAALANRD